MAGRKRVAHTAQEICAQVSQVREWLAHGIRPNQIRERCAAQWGLATRTAEMRIAAARQEMVRDIDTIDRKQLAAQAIETLLKIQEMSLDTRQGSNAIGATRLMLELAGILGRAN